MLVMFDRVMWLYLFGALICFYGFGLFLWWWIKMRDASAVYIYVTILFVGQAFTYSIQTYSRYLRNCERMSEYFDVVTSDIWFIRLVVPVSCFAAIVIHMTWRVLRGQPFKERRRSDDT